MGLSAVGSRKPLGELKQRGAVVRAVCSKMALAGWVWRMDKLVMEAGCQA